MQNVLKYNMKYCSNFQTLNVSDKSLFNKESHDMLPNISQKLTRNHSQFARTTTRNVRVYLIQDVIFLLNLIADLGLISSARSSKGQSKYL